MQFFKPEQAQTVDDKFMSLLTDPVKQKHQSLTNELQFGVRYALLSSLAMHADTFDLTKTHLVMMKNFTRSLMSSHTYKSSQFLKNDEASNSVPYTSDQLFQLDMQLKQYMSNLNEIKLDLCCLEIQEQKLAPQKFCRLQVFLRFMKNGCMQQIYSSLDDMSARLYSYQTQITEIVKKKADFKETCFIKIPTKDQKVLKDLFIVICVQFPLLSAQYMRTSTKEGQVISAQEILKKNKDLGDKYSLEQIMANADKLTFKTEYVCEIPLYDYERHSIIQNGWLSYPRVYKFQPTKMDVKQAKPFKEFAPEPKVVLDTSIQIISQAFSHERPLNTIITMHQKNQSFTNAELEEILEQTQRLSHSALIFNAEKLLTILLNIFAKVSDKEGSRSIFLAILYLVHFFKEVTPKHVYILNDFVSKKFKNSHNQQVYVKMLYQMHVFANQLEVSFETGFMAPNLKEYFTLFKHMPILL